jgi:GTP cyclohydrolase I
LFSDYKQSAAKVLDKVFEDIKGYGDMVLVRDIPFVSHCEHHIAPFAGPAYIAYYPSNGVVGQSKLTRLVDAFPAACKPRKP